MAAMRAALAALAAVSAVASEGPIIGGSGKWRYQWRPDLLQLPPGTEIQDAHGLEVDDNHNIYLTYANWNSTTSSKPANGTDQNCLIRWDPDGKNGQFMTKGGNQLCSGKPHGLKLANEGGKMFLYHSNVAETAHSRSGKLSKTTLEGEVVWQINGTFGQENETNYRPCWWGVPPSGEYIYLADGYGSSNVYPFTRDGKWTGKTFGGRGKEHGKFETCHGITFDPRVGQLAVSDRENHRIEFFDFDMEKGDKFAYSSTVTMAGIERPCNFRIIKDPSEPVRTHPALCYLVAQKLDLCAAVCLWNSYCSNLPSACPSVRPCGRSWLGWWWSQHWRVPWLFWTPRISSSR
jgi:hypothetical protein